MGSRNLKDCTACSLPSPTERDCQGQLPALGALRHSKFGQPATGPECCAEKGAKFSTILGPPKLAGRALGTSLTPLPRGTEGVETWKRLQLLLGQRTLMKQ